MDSKLSKINPDRRGFFSMAAALTLAAAQFGLVRPASAQPKTPALRADKDGGYFPGFSTEQIATSGTTIHVLRKGTGRPLLLHGYPETHLTWHKVAPQLAERFSVIVPDLRGYGDSGKPHGGERHENYSFRAMAQDQVEVMKALGHDRSYVAGHDRGGRTTHRMCLDHPDKVLKAAIIDIVPTLDMWAAMDKDAAIGGLADAAGKPTKPGKPVRTTPSANASFLRGSAARRPQAAQFEKAWCHCRRVRHAS